MCEDERKIGMGINVELSVGKEPPIPTASAYLDDAITSLHDHLSDLELRLTSVLATPAEAHPSSDESDSAPESALTSRLRGQAWAVRQATARVRSVTERVEL